jgi:hypothetical protein
MFLKRGKELLLSGFIVVETEFVLEDPFKFFLSFNKEIVVTSDIFLLKSRDLSFPWSEFFFILSNLDFEGGKFFESVLKRFGERGIDLEDFLTLLGSSIRTLLIDVLSETSMVVGDLQLVGFHLFQLIGQGPHSFSERLLVDDPVTSHFLKGISGDSFLGSSSFKFYLGVSFVLNDDKKSLISILNLRSDFDDFVIPCDLSFLWENVSSEVVKSPVKVVIEHEESSFSVSFLKSDVIDSGFSWSCGDFLLNEKSGISSAVEFIFINLLGESTLFMRGDLTCFLFKHSLLLSSFPSSNFVSNRRSTRTRTVGISSTGRRAGRGTGRRRFSLDLFTLKFVFSIL